MFWRSTLTGLVLALAYSAPSKAAEIPVNPSSSSPAIICEVAEENDASEKYCRALEYERLTAENKKLQQESDNAKRKIASLEREITENRSKDGSLRTSIGYSWRIDLSFYGFVAGYKIDGFSFTFAFNQEPHDKHSNDEIDISGIRIKGEQTQEQTDIWFNLSGSPAWLKFRRSYLTLEGAIQLSGGTELIYQKLKPEESDSDLPKDLRLHPFLGVGLRIDVLYPFSHLTSLPILDKIAVGGTAVLQYWDFSLTGRRDSEAYFRSLHALVSFSLD